MESSSEDSFAWTDTSSDSFDSNSLSTDVNMKDNVTKQHGTRKDRTSLSRMSPKLNNNDNLNMNDKEEQSFSKNTSLKKRSIKQEPESDNDVSKKKKKIRHKEMNGHENKVVDSVSYDESYLDMKVKQEESNAKSTTKKHKKTNQHSSYDSSDTKSNGNLDISETVLNDGNDQVLKQENENESISNKPKKKKKKSTKRREEEDDLVTENKNMKGLVKQNMSECIETSVAECNISDDSSGESGSNEISAIKCDDDHNSHTLSFNNKSLQNEKLNVTFDDNIAEKLTNHRISEQEYDGTFKQRTPRISDRIRFEDEEDSNFESSPGFDKTKKSAKLSKFTKATPHLKPLSQNLLSDLSISQNDEIWIMKCPKEIDSNDFSKTSLNVNSKSKIKVGGQSYESIVENEQSDKVALLTWKNSKYQIQNLPLSGVIQLRKRIPKAHYRDDNIMENNQTNFIPLPETKCRHPLFGSNYKKAMKVPSAIAERLNNQDTEDSLTVTEKKKKKKHKRDRTPDQIDTCVQNDTAIKSEDLFEKKKKKRKAAEDKGPAPKKAKYIKHDPESANVWDSEKAIEENLFNF